MFGGLAVGSSVGWGQSVTLMEPEAPLLPATFGEWTRVDAAAGCGGGCGAGYSLLGVDAQALGECGERRSKAADYTRGGRTVHVEAIQFGDRTGAYSAFTLAERPGMRVGSELGRTMPMRWRERGAVHGGQVGGAGEVCGEAR